MSYHFSPKIVTDGLVYYADVVNSKSFNGTNELRDLTKVNADNPIIVSPNSYTQSDMGYLDTWIQPLAVPNVMNGFEYGFHWDSNWTHEFWFKPNYSFGGNSILNDYSTFFGTATRLVYIIINSQSAAPYLTIYRNYMLANNTNGIPSLSSAITNNKWIQLTITLTNNTTIKIYTNGILVNSINVNYNNSVGNINCVYDLKIINDKILVVGAFYKYNEVVVGYGLAQLNDDGTIDNTFNKSKYSNIVKTLDYDSINSRIYISGFFAVVSNGSDIGLNTRSLVSLNTNGDILNRFTDATFANPETYKIKYNVANDRVYLSTNVLNRFYRVMPNMTLDATYSALLFNGLVLDFEFDNGNNHNYTVGAFTSYNSTTYNRLARLSLDGILDTTFSIGSGFNNTTQCIKLVTNKLYIGGDFTSFNSNSINRIIRINTDGTIDNTFSVGTGFNSTVKCITVDQDGKLLIGGDFTTYNGVSANRIIRLNTDGTRDNTFNIGTGFNRIVNAIQVDSNNKIIVGGFFSSYNSQSYNGIIRLNNDGSIDNTFNVGIGFSRMNERPSVLFNNLGNPYTIGSSGNIIDKMSLGMSMIRFYNKALTDAEVLKNFNATRGRYGL